MKSFLHSKAKIFTVTLFSLLVVQLQAQLTGGTIAATSICASKLSPASPIVNVASATGGTGTLKYQWEARIDLSGWASVIGGADLTLNPGTLSWPTFYRRKVVDELGNVAYSNEVKIILTENLGAGTAGYTGITNNVLVNTPAALITSQPAQDGSGNYGYQWQRASSANGPWSDIGGETSLNYQPGTFTTQGNYFFRKKSTDLTCGTIAYSNVVTLVVLTIAPYSPGFINYAQPCFFAGATPALLQGSPATGGNEPYLYQWQSASSQGGPFTDIAGATNLSYQPPILNATTWFRRRVIDNTGNAIFTSEIRLGLSQPNPGIIAGNETSIAPNAPYDAAISIQTASNFFNGGYVWQKSLDNGTTWINIPNYGHSTYYPSVTPTTVATCYRRGLQESCSPGNQTFWTNTVCIQPANPLTAGSISINGNTSSCTVPGTSPGPITGTPATGGSQPYTYKWQKFVDPNWVDIAGTNTVSYNPGNLNFAAKFRRIVKDAANTELISNEVTILLQSTASLKGGIIDGPIVTCSNTAPGIINNILDACGGGGTLSYTWEFNNGTGWNVIGGENQPTHNATAITADTRYRRKVADGCGNGVYSNEVPVYVYPTIEAGTIAPAMQTVCTDEIPEILSLVQNCHYTNGNVTYQWQRATSASGPWTNMSSATLPVYGPKISNVTLYYRLVVRSTVCNAQAISNVATVVVSSCTSSGRTSVFSASPSNVSGISKGTIKVYPNPINKGETLLVNFTGNGSNCKALLRGVDGRSFACTIIAAQDKALQIRIPQNLSSGTYLVQITDGKEQWIERIVVM